MSVVPLTLTISLCLVFTFVLFFLREFTRRRFSGAESDSLLPLAEETPRLAGVPGHGSRIAGVFDTTVVTDLHNAASGGCGNHSLDTVTANGSPLAHVAHDPGTCTRNCAACRLRALHRAAASAITVGTT
jgi:hypothetical protein